MNFNSEKIGHKNSSAHEHLSKKYAAFFTIHGHQSRANLWRFFDFQAITLHKGYILHIM